MKAVSIDDQIYLVLDRTGAQAIAAACLTTAQSWTKDPNHGNKWAALLTRAADEIINAVLRQKVANVTQGRQK